MCYFELVTNEFIEIKVKKHSNCIQIGTSLCKASNS